MATCINIAVLLANRSDTSVLPESSGIYQSDTQRSWESNPQPSDMVAELISKND